MSDAGLEARLVVLIEETTGIAVPDTHTDLLDSGLLDSLALVSLLAELEAQLGFQLLLDDFDLEDFRTVGRMADHLSATGVGAQGSPSISP